MNVADQIRNAEDGRQSKGTRHDCRVAFGPAEDRREATDDLRVHQGGVGWRNVFGQDDAAARQLAKAGQVVGRQAAHDAQADLADFLRAGAQVGIFHLREIQSDGGDLGHDGGFGVAPVVADACRDAADEAG